MTADTPQTPAEKCEVICAHCGGRATWEETWKAYMHWDEAQEDNHAVVVPDPSTIPVPA